MTTVIRMRQGDEIRVTVKFRGKPLEVFRMLGRSLMSLKRQNLHTFPGVDVLTPDEGLALEIVRHDKIKATRPAAGPGSPVQPS